MNWGAHAGLLRFARSLAVLSLLAMTLVVTLPGPWHPETPGTHCALCQAASMPFVVAPAAPAVVALEQTSVPLPASRTEAPRSRALDVSSSRAPPSL